MTVRRKTSSNQRVISFANQKGGVGKTTCVANIGYSLAHKGYGVLMVDMDPQAHLTASFGFEPDDMAEKGVCEIMEGDKGVEGVEVEEGLDILPANLGLAGVEFGIAGEPGREMILKSYIDTALPYDYVLIDCPPSLGLLTLNALTASNEVYIPMQAEFLPLRGVNGLLDTIELVKSRLNPGLAVTGVIVTRVNKRKLLARSVLEKIGEYFGDRVFNTLVRENVAVAEAPGGAQTIFEYAPESHGAEDFDKLTEEIIEQEKGGRDGAE